MCVAKKKAQLVVGAVQDSTSSSNEVVCIPAEKLEGGGITAADVQKLIAEGLATVESVLYSPRKRLLQIKGISEAKADKLILAASKLVNIGFKTGNAALESRMAITKLTTGSKRLDKLLDGGIECGSSTELFGEFRTGKTQLCHQLCVTCQLPKNMGGGQGGAVYIDTEKTFRPERIVDIAHRYNLDPHTVLDNVLYAQAFNSDHQMKILKELPAIMVHRKISLIVVDSVTNLFRSDYCGRGELAERQAKLGAFLRFCLTILDSYEVAIVMTNQVVATVDGTAMFGAEDKKPVGGNIMAHFSTLRLQLRKGRDTQRICKIYDSPNLPSSECVFVLGQNGIADDGDD